MMKRAAYAWMYMVLRTKPSLCSSKTATIALVNNVLMTISTVIVLVITHVLNVGENGTHDKLLGWQQGT